MLYQIGLILIIVVIALIVGKKLKKTDSTNEELVFEDDMTKKELEEYGRTLGIELDRRHKKEDLIEEPKEAEGE